MPAPLDLKSYLHPWPIHNGSFLMIGQWEKHGYRNGVCTYYLLEKCMTSFLNVPLTECRMMVWLKKEILSNAIPT